MHPLRETRLSLPRPLTQKQLADFAGVSASTIERAERGEPIRVDCIQRICEALDKKPKELGLLSTESEEKQNSTEASQDRVNTQKVSRREAMKIGAVVGTTLLTTPQELLNPEPWERFARALKKPRSIDQATLEHLEILAKDSWQLIPDVTGIISRDLLKDVIERFQYVTELLEGSLPTPIHRQLCSIGGELALVAGKMFSAMQDYESAQAYYQVAIDAAQEANNHALRAVGLGRFSFIPTYNGEVQHALPFVLEARHLAAHNATPTTRAWLAAVEAEIRANKGEQDACFKALELAELVTSSTQPEDDPYMTTFTPSLLAGYKGVCYLRLHQPQAAQAALQEALLHANTSSRCYVLTDLAAAFAEQKEIEEACKRAGQALAITTSATPMDVLQRIGSFRGQLEPWQDVQAVKDLDKHIRFAWRKTRELVTAF